MKTDCPHCSKRIRWWNYLGGRPAPGERRLLPNRAITVCPFCRADIATNIHPLEKRLQLFVFTPLALGLAVVFGLPGLPALWIPALGVLLLILGAAGTYVHLRTRDWQRFRRHDGDA
jgi:hypothetical protein